MIAPARLLPIETPDAAPVAAEAIELVASLLLNVAEGSNLGLDAAEQQEDGEGQQLGG